METFNNFLSRIVESKNFDGWLSMVRKTSSNHPNEKVKIFLKGMATKIHNSKDLSDKLGDDMMLRSYLDGVKSIVINDIDNLLAGGYDIEGLRDMYPEFTDGDFGDYVKVLKWWISEYENAGGIL